MSFFSTSNRPAAIQAAPYTGPLISLRNIEKSFDTAAGRSYVLRRISADVSPGEFISIMGPSGAGKSTLMSIIGMLFQQYHLIDDPTVAENLDMPLSYRNYKKSEREAMVADVLDKFGMVAKKDLYPRQLSGGQQQLVGVARAVIAKPKLILADEPTGNLHSSQGREIMELFKKLNDAGTTIIQVTHSEENAKFGNRIIELKDGWITGSEGPVV